MFRYHHFSIFESPSTHYRLRAEFKVWHEGQKTHYAMTDAETRKPIFLGKLSSCI